MFYKRQAGVPAFTCEEYSPRQSDCCILIPVINKGSRILHELQRAQEAGGPGLADIIICDGGSTDGSLQKDTIHPLGGNTLLTKQGSGKQGAQLRMGIWWTLERGYTGLITIDGNDKDGIEDVLRFLETHRDGYDLIHGSRFIRGGKAINTPAARYLAVRLLHAPVISLTARQWFTDTTNAYRAYSTAYLRDPRVAPLWEVFAGYELLAYLSVRATQLGYRACEIPVTRAYPKTGKTPTKISFLKGNWNLIQILFRNLCHAYDPK